MKKNRVRKISAAAALAIGVLSAPCAVADFELTVKIPGITEGKAKAEIDVLSWSWALSQSSANLKDKSLVSGSACVDIFTLTKDLDPTTPRFIMASALGTLLSSAEFAVREVDGQGNLIRELTIDMLNVVISSYKTGSSGSEDRPMEEITLNFGSIEGEYMEFDYDPNGGGTVITNWSVDKAKSDCK